MFNKSVHVLVKRILIFSNIKLQENSSVGTDGRRDMTKLIMALLDYANASEKYSFVHKM